MDSMRSRPFHECVEGRTNTNYRVHYELLIATIDSKRALLNKMVTHQITSERKTRNRNVNVVNESHSSRNAMETMFEITLSMGNVARFFPLWNITINQMTENVSNTYLGTTANSSSSNNNNNFNRDRNHLLQVIVCQFNLDLVLLIYLIQQILYCPQKEKWKNYDQLQLQSYGVQKVLDCCGMQL